MVKCAHFKHNDHNRRQPATMNLFVITNQCDAYLIKKLRNSAGCWYLNLLKRFTTRPSRCVNYVFKISMPRHWKAQTASITYRVSFTHSHTNCFTHIRTKSSTSFVFNFLSTFFIVKLFNLSKTRNSQLGTNISDTRIESSNYEIIQVRWILLQWMIGISPKKIDLCTVSRIPSSVGQNSEISKNMECWIMLDYIECN